MGNLIGGTCISTYHSATSHNRNMSVFSSLGCITEAQRRRTATGESPAGARSCKCPRSRRCASASLPPSGLPPPLHKACTC